MCLLKGTFNTTAIGTIIWLCIFFNIYFIQLILLENASAIEWDVGNTVTSVVIQITFMGRIMQNTRSTIHVYPRMEKSG